MKDKVIKDYRPFKATLAEVSFAKEHKISLIHDTEPAHKVYSFDGISKTFAKKMRGQKNMSCDGY